VASARDAREKKKQSLQSGIWSKEKQKYWTAGRGKLLEQYPRKKALTDENQTKKGSGALDLASGRTRVDEVDKTNREHADADGPPEGGHEWTVTRARTQRR